MAGFPNWSWMPIGGAAGPDDEVSGLSRQIIELAFLVSQMVGPDSKWRQCTQGFSGAHHHEDSPGMGIMVMWTRSPTILGGRSPLTIDT